MARTVFREQSAPSTVAFVDSPMTAVMETWRLGDNHLFCASMTSNHLSRTARDVRRGPTGTIGIAVQTFGVARFEQDGDQRIVRPGDMMVVELDAPYEFGWAGWGCSRCLHIPTSDVGLTGTQIREAARRLTTSPLYAIVRRHIDDLCIDRDDEVPGLATESLAASSNALIRCLLAPHDPAPDDADIDRWVRRVDTFLTDHLTDPDLSIGAVAGHLDTPVSEVTRLAAVAGVDVPRWITAKRLHRAHADLRRRRTEPDAAFARAHGFADLATFEASFRDLYGLTPRTWWEIRHES
ncbi:MULTISPECIES: helix-turn-helix domain-containing protein [unclassified Gordonia (in: high G+C Gram-positive bacteria)]|uniref:AraC-like ligand-binding domain-containing protein n=1 Tax=unclassified Gordonia (in: high G+C Gram-positive bacteria) TaxID=2657482 RepID=UPI00071DBCC9|nr:MULTISPECIES: helix-turn-helix domain-containing protein [unclassified Gordonia (in: high G+C Gram-positive bacteria)]KSU54509.1 hypothetical protein AS181_21180 [Gordonia sp. SGD-V-85]MBR7193250.1 helix-turn-helix domain-containing protein [Gordonia sp. SCSIO 19800]MDT0222097.1 helix-turn-helix domain-containing protein [Gordonia sp. AC31]SCC53949.1 AraC-type DNA-binding protein [Gordonia sp. v-85]